LVALILIFTKFSCSAAWHKDDGAEMEFGPGDAFYMPLGHDAWIVGDKRCVLIDFTGLGNTPSLPRRPAQKGRRLANPNGRNFEKGASSWLNLGKSVVPILKHVTVQPPVPAYSSARQQRANAPPSLHGTSIRAAPER
jgi:hypothetical protein